MGLKGPFSVRILLLDEKDDSIKSNVSKIGKKNKVKPVHVLKSSPRTAGVSQKILAATHHRSPNNQEHQQLQSTSFQRFAFMEGNLEVKLPTI